MSFYIKEVSLSSETKQTATVTFNSGLNIICGVSDTGKSGIIKTIHYFMGGDKPFKYEETGYDTAQIIIATSKGDISLSRSIKPRALKLIEVVSQNPDFSNTTYDAEYKSGSNKSSIDIFWFKLLGIEGEPKIISTVDFARKRLTIKILSFLFVLLRKNMAREESIFIKTDSFDKNYRLASFIYLFTGNDFSHFEVQEKDEISAAKRQALSNFVSSQIKSMESKISTIEKGLPKDADFDIDEYINKMRNELFAVNEEINNLSEDNKNLVQQLLPLRTKETEAYLVIKQFKELESQYKADIQRLNLVLEGENHFNHLEQNEYCPFCNNKLQPETVEKYSETVNAELSRIVSQLDGLIGTISDVTTELKEIQSQIKETESQKAKNSEKIEHLLSPKAYDLKNKIVDLQEYTKLQSESETIKELATSINADLQEQIKTTKTKTKFSATENFPKDFERIINEIAFNTLRECQYENLLTSNFNISKFDLEINNSKKSTHGQGYLSFINTVCGLVLRKYIQDYSLYKIGTFMVDSPLLGLEQGDDDTPDSMKIGLFQYFINHQNEGQIIVVENRQNLPEIDYEGNGVKVIEFTRDKYTSRFSESRYGFLYDVFE